LSEVHIVTGAGFETATGGLLEGTKETIGATGLKGCGAKDFAAAGLVQFSGDETGVSGSLMVSAGGGVVVGCDAQPARKISVPQKMIPANLNTRQLCGTWERTQDVSSFTICDLRFTISRRLKILVAITGASGALYAQRLLDNLDPREHEIHVVQSNYAQQVIAEELPGGLKLPDGVKSHGLKSMNAPFASGSNPPDAMVVIPCTMGTMGRIAHGYSEDVLLRAADVTLKEKRKLILVPRETPLSLVHVKNMELLLLAGATILPANPSFYAGPKTIQDVADTVVARVLDHLGVPQKLVPRWSEEKE
jgi:4-hydroxy-3-polyprenylbenzoate decarboxylase